MDSASRGGLWKVSLMVDATTGVEVEPFRSALSGRSIPSTFWVDPRRLVERADFWRACAAEGHEIGNGTFLDAASLDGTLARWTLSMVETEVEESAKLWSEVLGSDAAPSIGIPFGDRSAHDGDYLNLLVEMGAAVCASDVAKGVAVWPAETTRPQDLTGGMVHAVHLARSKDNRSFQDEASLAEWVGWAGGLPRGTVATVAQALGPQSPSPISGA